MDGYDSFKSQFSNLKLPDGQTFQGVNRFRIWVRGKSYTINKETTKGYDTYPAPLEVLVPAFTNAFETIFLKMIRYMRHYYIKTN